MRRALLMCVLLVLVPLGAATPAAAQNDDTTCETTVTHDAFRSDETTVTEATNGTASSTVENTEVSVDTNVGFVHLSAENPNGYCVNYVVEISPDVIDPADLGEIEANNGTETASWQAIHDFDADETYTKVEFALEGGESATFAPSKLRVTSLKWTGDAKEATSGILPDIDLGLGAIFGDGDLEQRKYTLAPENSSGDSVSVALSNDSLDKEITEYQAVYRIGDGRWIPVQTDSSDPVYKDEGEGTVTFHFDESDAEVEFIANPTMVDKATHEYRAYMAGADWIQNLIPGFAGASATLHALTLPLTAAVTHNP
ncbi:hypothetical protein [Natrinema sp. DC36]|uniref:hypothetical protein n=1 Tax=Natrinema sp. DC36 TaxID=2878680 RepID=UPI001CF09DE4|nr:hypothetical protein [Natrinema sp. DC36]